MIVLDTGSVDDTRAIAAAEGVEVATFEWVDDFSAARNASLALSDAAWNLVLDADEWIAGGAQSLGPETLPAAGGDFMGEIRRDNQLDKPGSEGAMITWIPRVLPRASVTRAASTSSRWA